MEFAGNGGRLSAATLSAWRGRVVRSLRRLGGGPVLAGVTVGGAALLAESMHLLFHVT